MAMPAVKFEPEDPLEDRVARLEVNVEHIQKDVSEMKVDIRRLNDKIDGVDQRLTGKIDSLKDALTTLAINMEKQFGVLRTARAFDRVWYLLMTGTMLGVVARAFKWI
jgi:predicted nuclease with TOPRIM domain